MAKGYNYYPKTMQYFQVSNEGPVLERLNQAFSSCKIGGQEMIVPGTTTSQRKVMNALD